MTLPGETASMLEHGIWTQYDLGKLEKWPEKTDLDSAGMGARFCRYTNKAWEEQFGRQQEEVGVGGL